MPRQASTSVVCKMRSASPSDDSSGPGTPPEDTPISNMQKHEENWKAPHTFHTLDMQRRFMKPSAQTWDVPALREISRPHIESFNALWAEDPSVDLPGSANKAGMEGMGLLERSLQTLAPRVVYDNHGAEGERGNRLESTSEPLTRSSPHRLCVAEPPHGP